MPIKTLIDSAQRFTVLRALAHEDCDVESCCTDPLAQYFLDPSWSEALKFRDMFIRRFEASAPGVYAYAIARTKYFDIQVKAAVQENIRQVLLIGSGFDSRAYRILAERPVTYFEFDRESIHELKEQRASASGIGVGNNRVKRIPADFSKSPIEDIVRSAGVDFDEPFLMIAEGLVYYFSQEFFRSLLGLISRYGQKRSIFAFDYASIELVHSWRSLHGGEEMHAFLESGLDPFLFFSSPEEIVSESEAHGLEVKSDLGTEAIEAQLIGKAETPGCGKVAGGFRLAAISKR